MYKLTPFEIIRLKLNSLVNKKSESDFLIKKPKLTRIEASKEKLDFNSQAIHIFKQIKNL